jgi:hypothetical protein
VSPTNARPSPFLLLAYGNGDHLFTWQEDRRWALQCARAAVRIAERALEAASSRHLFSPVSRAAMVADLAAAVRSLCEAMRFRNYARGLLARRGFFDEAP